MRPEIVNNSFGAFGFEAGIAYIMGMLANLESAQ